MGRRKCTSTVVDLHRLLALVISMGCWNVAAVAQAQPLYGGTMVLATFAHPGALNPALTTSVPTHIVTGPVFNGLVAHDFASSTPCRTWLSVGRCSDDGRMRYIYSSWRNTPYGMIAGR